MEKKINTCPNCHSPNINYFDPSEGYSSKFYVCTNCYFTFEADEDQIENGTKKKKILPKTEKPTTDKPSLRPSKSIRAGNNYR